MMNTENIKVVLVNTSHTGNIGAAARAMKTMGLTRLCLVKPDSELDGKARAMASHALDILEKAEIVDTLEEAVADCKLIMATSARDRNLPWPMLAPKEAGVKAINESSQGEVAIVFGRESRGLTNEELQQAHFHIHIPGNEEYPVLNLAAAVQVICYEVRLAQLAKQPQTEEVVEYPPQKELEYLFSHMEQTLKDIGFIAKNTPQQTTNKLRRILTRARLESTEVQMLHGVFNTIDNVEK